MATAATSLALAIYLKTSGKEIIQKIKQQLQQLKKDLSSDDRNKDDYTDNANAAASWAVAYGIDTYIQILDAIVTISEEPEFAADGKAENVFGSSKTIKDLLDATKAKIIATLKHRKTRRALIVKRAKSYKGTPSPL